MKKVFFIITLFLCNIAIFAQENDNPYSMFGYEPKISDVNYSDTAQFCLYNTDTTALVQTLVFNFERGKVFLYNANEQVLTTLPISKETIARFNTIDPLAEKYPHISPYAFCGNNPVNRIDPDGRDWYVFNEDTKKFDRRIEMDGEHRMLIYKKEITEDGLTFDTYTFKSFADPIEDAKDIDNGLITQYISVSNKEIQSILESQGAFSSNMASFGWESQGGHNFDYSYSVLPYKYPHAEFNKKTMKSNALFLPEGDHTVHNFMNFGNYLWGATGYTVGWSYAQLQIGAHLNSRLNSKRNGYPPQWDSKDDQRSIVLGIFRAQNNNYRKKRK